jgi:prepilin-type N-terminal cleavage/methylation domain-containing protein
MTRTASAASGFTLIELAVVAAIVGLLTGLLMPLLTISQREARRTSSHAVMAKVESSLHQFKNDFKAYPYQLSYSSDGAPAVNTLAYTLGTDLTPSNRANVLADMATAAANYQYDCSTSGGGWSERLPPVSTQTYISNRNNGNSSWDQNGDPEGDVAPVGSTYNNITKSWYFTYQSMTYSCALLNRMAAERANLLMLIGDITAGGCVMQEVDGPAPLVHHGRDCSGTPLVANPASLSHPGWAQNYLMGEVPASAISGDQILDAWRHPLIYICQVQPGIEPTIAQINNSTVNIDYPSQYGLQPIGRRLLEPLDPATMQPIQGDPATLPDTSNLMHDDMRAWAPPGYELEFELWSAGPDGSFSWWRDDSTNTDNIPCEPYNQRIGTQP